MKIKSENKMITIRNQNKEQKQWEAVIKWGINGNAFTQAG